MIAVDIEERTRAFRRLAESLSPKNANVATVRAINVAIRKANTQYRRLIVGQYNLKYADTKEIAVASRATYASPVGKISGDMKPISLSRFNPVFVKDGRKYSIKGVKDSQTKKRSLSQAAGGNAADVKGVTFAIKKGETKTVPFAFMVTNSQKPGISVQVWARGEYKGNKFEKGKERLPITALKTVSPFGALTNSEVAKKIGESAPEDMGKEFERQVGLLLSRAGAR